MSDYKGAAKMIDAFPNAKTLLADKGYDADWFRATLAQHKITACIPSRANRKVAIPHDPVLYKKRHKIENMFGRLKDWRRIHTRYDRCANTLPSSQASVSRQPSSSRFDLMSPEPMDVGNRHGHGSTRSSMRRIPRLPFASFYSSPATMPTNRPSVR